MDLSLIPAAWMPAVMWLVAFLISVLGFVGLVGALLAGVKWCLGDPTPKDPPWKVKAFDYLKYADPIAFNTRRIKDALVILQQQLDLAYQRQLLQQQAKTIQEHELTISTQDAFIKASIRPPAPDNDNGRGAA